MSRGDIALVGQNFHGFRFYFNFNVYHVKIQFFLQFLESTISEKTHPKTDIGQMETVSVVRDIKRFMEVKDFRKMFFFSADSHEKKFPSIYV